MNSLNLKKFIFASSSEIYKSSENKIKESGLKNVRNSYLESTLVIENFLKWASKSEGIESVILRYSNVCGSDKSGVIGEFHTFEKSLISMILKNEKVTIVKNRIRDYIHVDDVANANIAAIQYLLSGGKSKTFNIGSGKGVSEEEILRICEKLMQKKVDFVLRNSKGSTVILDSELAKNELDWNLKVKDIEEMIESTFSWLQKNPKGYQVEPVGDLLKVKMMMKQLGY
jgi:UDP-glucose 4-epimerase